MKSPGRSRKKTKSPLPGRNIVYQPPSPKFQVEPPPRKKLLPKSIDDKKPITEFTNPREQIADLVMQVQKTSLPIALDRKYTTDKRLIFLPSDNPPDDPAGSVLFTKHGFFEIPKEKNQPSKFISKREFIMESYYKDVFSKLPLVINFYRRKFLAKWFLETRKAHYKKHRQLLKENLWLSADIFAKTFTRITKPLYGILNIHGIEMKENIVYGKRHVEFNQRQQVALTEATKVYEASTSEIVNIMEEVTSTLRKTQAKQKEDLKNQQMAEKIETRKDPFIGIEKKKRGKARYRELKEQQMKLQEKLNDAYLISIRLRYLSTISEMLEKNFEFICSLLCSQHKPKFELILMIRETLYLEPELDIQKNTILTCANNLMNVILSNRYMTEIEAFFNENFYIAQPCKVPYSAFISLALQSTQRFKTYKDVLEKEIDRDIEASAKFTSQYKHLESIKMVGVSWLNQLKDKFFDVVAFYKDNYEQFNKFSLKIDEIPTTNYTSGMLTIETASLRNNLQEIPKGVISSLKERLLEIITHESSELKTELFTHHALLEEKASTLPQFVEQVMSTSVLKQTKLKEWERKIGFVSECVNLCRKENVRIPGNTSMAIDECRNIIKNLPSQISKAEVHYQEYRAHFENQMQRGSSQLSKKIQKFQVKYIDRYLFENDRLGQTISTMKELEKREEALSAMKQRVELYEEFNNALACIRPPGEEVVAIQCRQEFTATFELHCDTLKFWKLANYWREHLEGWLASTFLKLQVPKMYKKIDKILAKLKVGTFVSKLFMNNSEKMLKMLSEEIEEIVAMKEILFILKSEVLKPRHWELIFKIIKKPHFMNIPFKLQDLKEASMPKFLNKIQHLYLEAKEESRQESNLINIKNVWDTLEFITEPYRDRMDTFTLKNYQEVQLAIEEHLAIIENIEKTQYSEHIQPEIDDWRMKLRHMQKVLEYWVNAQEAWLQLEPIFTSGHMQETLPQEHEAFNSIQSNLRRIMWNTYNTPKAAFNLLVANRDNILLSILDGLSRLRKNIKGFLETRRSNFPRFFFLSDPQLLEFLSKIHSREQYDKHISVIFPGCYKLYVKEINPRHFVTEEDQDPDKAPFSNFTPAGNELLGPFEFSESSLIQDTGIVQGNDSNLVVKQQVLIEKYPEEIELGGMHPYEILGMFGANQEVLFFEKSVGIHEGVEGWISEVERQMKESISKMLSFAVSTFPKQSLDEWVLDYPQQVIYTAVLLILTHEITELMEENAKDTGSNSSESYDEGDGIPEDYEEHFSKVYFGSVTNSKTMGQSKLEMMKILQSKNYRGLFLRLQFWINQLTKSIQADQETKQRLSPVHLMALRSLVLFLCYQRDVVGILLEKKILSTDDFEWMKHFRIYWRADENITKIECGGLHMMQGAEYLGTSYRLLCTPLTTKYFLYISCSLRESSSVMFKTNTSHQCAGDIFEEFCNWCGMGSKTISITEGTSTSTLMQVLNGAALANLWVIFEHINKLCRADLQVIIKEIQMVQQQFLISETTDSNMDSSVNKSARSGSDSSSHQVKLPIKSPTSLFVVLASVNPYSPLDSGLMITLSNSFRCTEMMRPDYKITASVMFIREGFRYHQGLSRMISDFCRNLIEKFDLQLAITTRDIQTVIVIAKKFKDALSVDNDLELGETQAVGKACKLYFIPKLMHTTGPGDKEKAKEKAVYEIIDDCVASVFRKRQRGAFEQPELRKGLEQAFQSLKFMVQEHQIRVAEEIYYGLRFHRAVMILGEKNSGKSAVLSLLSTALKNLYELQVSDYPINPNIFTYKQFFGSLNSEKIQKPGILTRIIEPACEEAKEFHAKWLVFECEKLKSWWLESFLSFIDHSPLLRSECYTLEPWELCLSQKTMANSVKNSICLPNLVHIYIPKDMQLIFKCENVGNASPAIFTKLSTHYIRENYVSWECFIVPVSKDLSEKFIKYGLLSQWVQDIFQDQINPFVTKLHKQFKNSSVWNTKALTQSYCKLLDPFIELGIIPYSKALGENEGLYSPSTQELYDYSIKYANSHLGLQEFKARLELVMVFSTIWTYGLVLCEEEKLAFSSIFKKHFAGNNAKYHYPDDLDIFDNYIDWESMGFMQIFSEFSLYGLTSPQPPEILVPSQFICRAYFICKQIIVSSQNHYPSLYHVNLFGPVSSGKTSLIKILSANYQNMTINRTVDNNLSIKRLHTAVSKNAAFKTPGMDNEKKILMVIEDMHLDESGDLGESIMFWIKHKGYYDPKNLVFKEFHDINFITCSYEVGKDSTGHCLYMESPNASIYKQSLVNYVYLRPTPIDMLIHRFLKLITSVISSIRQDHLDDPIFSFQRVLKHYKTLLFFTSNLELYPETELKEEERVSEILIYETFRSFRDALRDKKPLELKILDIVSKKLKVVKESVDFMYGNYAQDEVEYNILIPYTKQLNSKYRDIQSFIVEKAGKYSLLSEDQTLTISAHCLHSSSLDYIWAFCRILQGDYLHGIIEIPVGQGAYECLQMACLLKNTRLIESHTKLYGDTERFKLDFENALFSVLLGVRKNQVSPENFVPCVFLCHTAHIKERECFDFLNAFITGEESDLKIFSQGFIEKVSTLEKRKIQLAAVSVKDEDPVKSAVVSARRYFHTIVMTTSTEEYEKLHKSYPRLLEKCEIILDATHTDFTESSNLMEKYLTYKGIESSMADIITELFMYIRGVFERKEYYISLDHSPIETTPISTFMCNKRLILFVDLLALIINERTEKMKDYKSTVENMLNKTKKFQKLHSQLENNMTSLQDFSMRTSSNISSIKMQIEKIRKTQQGKYQLIEEKEKLNSKLQEELDEVQKDNEKVLSDKTMKLEANLNGLITMLQEPEKILSLKLLPDANIQKLLDFLLGITGLQDPHFESKLPPSKPDSNVQSHKSLSNFSLEEALRDSETFIDLLKSKENSVFPAKFTESLVDYMGKTVRSKFNGEVELAIYDYLTALVDRIEITKMLEPQMSKVEELKNEIINNNVSITYAQKYIMDIERELKQYLDQERRFSSELQRRKQPLRTSEITHIRTENLITAVNELNKRLQDKMNIIEKLEKNLIGDSYILACNIAYLGVLNVAQRAEVRGALSNILETNEISTDEAWQDQYLNSHKIAMKRILKALKFTRITTGCLDDLDGHEGLLTYYFTRNISVFIDEHGDLQDLLLEKYCKEKTIPILCSVINSANLLEEALQHDSQIFLEDFNEVNEKTDLKGWKIGPGLTLDNPVVHKLWEYNMSFTSNPTKYKNICIFSPRFPLSLSLHFWSSNIFMCINSVSEDKALSEIKETFIKHLLAEYWEKYTTAKDLYLEKQKEFREVNLRKKLELTQLDMDSLQNYDNFIDLLEIIRVVDQAKELYEEAKEGYEKLLQENNFLNTYGYITFLLYISLKQVGRLIGDVTYSWKNFIRIIRAICIKTMRDAKLSAEGEGKTQSADEDFYSRELLPAIWSTIRASVPQENAPLLSLIFSLNLGVMRESITLDNFDVFGQLIMQDPGICTWMTSFDRTPTDGNFEENFNAMQELLLTWFPDSDECLGKIRETLTQYNFSKLEVGNVFKSVLSSEPFKDIPLFAKILIAAHNPDSMLKTLLRQFVFENMNSVFEYQEEFCKLNHFIKTASWSLPILLHSWPGINIVNTICSLANYYGVGLEVIRTDPEIDDSSKTETIETIDLIMKCAGEGTWVLISTTLFPSFWKKTLSGLNELRESNKISNTFRFFIDIQGLRHYEIPDSFLHEECIRFYMSQANAEDLEGFEDVWTSILLENVIKPEVIEAEQISSIFIENSELKNF